MVGYSLDAVIANRQDLVDPDAPRCWLVDSNGSITEIPDLQSLCLKIGIYLQLNTLMSRVFKPNSYSAHGRPEAKGIPQVDFNSWYPSIEIADLVDKGIDQGNGCMEALWPQGDVPYRWFARADGPNRPP